MHEGNSESQLHSIDAEKALPAGPCLDPFLATRTQISPFCTQGSEPDDFWQHLGKRQPSSASTKAANGTAVGNSTAADAPEDAMFADLKASPSMTLASFSSWKKPTKRCSQPLHLVQQRGSHDPCTMLCRAVQFFLLVSTSHVHMPSMQ